MLEGLYISILPNGDVERTLVTPSGTMVLEKTTIADELILFSELCFDPYSEVGKYLATIAMYLPSPSEHTYTQEEINAYELFCDVTEDLVDTLTEENPLSGTLLATLLFHGVLRPGWRDLAAADDTKAGVLQAIVDPMWFHFQLNDVFFSMLDGKEFDAGEKFPYLKEYYVTQMVSLGEELTTQYVFASESNYLAFLLIHFIMAKPRLQMCRCCGRYFIPKTKQRTLYCDRIFKDDRTCKQVAPKLKHQIAAMNHTVIQTFDRAKRRMYKRYERALEGKALSEKDLTLFEYYEWLQAATRARDACLYGKLSQEEALRIIDVP